MTATLPVGEKVSAKGHPYPEVIFQRGNFPLKVNRQRLAASPLPRLPAIMGFEGGGDLPIPFGTLDLS